MKMIKTKHGKVLVMSMVDAEHCNFDQDALAFESSIREIKDRPNLIIIKADDCIVTEKTKESTLKKMAELSEKADKLLDKMIR